MEPVRAFVVEQIIGLTGLSVDDDYVNFWRIIDVSFLLIYLDPIHIEFTSIL